MLKICFFYMYGNLQRHALDIFGQASLIGLRRSNSAGSSWHLLNVFSRVTRKS